MVVVICLTLLVKSEEGSGEGGWRRGVKRKVGESEEDV